MSETLTPKQIVDLKCNICEQNEPQYIYIGNCITKWCKNCQKNGTETIVYNYIGPISKEGERDYKFFNEIIDAINNHSKKEFMERKDAGI